MLSQELDCYLLDYNGYIVLSENREEVDNVLLTLYIFIFLSILFCIVLYIVFHKKSFGFYASVLNG